MPLRCPVCKATHPRAQLVGCKLRWPPDRCPYCMAPGDFLSGRCDNPDCKGTADLGYNPRREPIWDPERCPRMVDGTKCAGFARRMDYRDWGLAPMPEEPPAWALYWIGVHASLAREVAVGMGGAVHGPIPEAEARAMLESFPGHQEAAIRHILGEIEAGEAEGRHDLAVRDAEERREKEAGKPTPGS